MDSKPVFLLRTDKSLLKTEVTDEERDYRESHYPDEKKVLKEKVKCTACDANIKEETFSKLKVDIHPALEVIVCENCQEFYGDGDFSADEDGSDKYCRWCGQGGNLYCCSQCSVAICAKCVKRNFAKSYLTEIEDDDWKCFICDTKPIWPHRALCDAVQQYIEANSKKKKSSKRGKTYDTASESEETETPSRRSKRKKKNSSSEEEIAKAESVEKSKRGSIVTKDKLSSSGEQSSSTDVSLIINPDKQRAKLLEHVLKDTINDYEKLTDLMIKIRTNYVNKYLKNKRFIRNPANASILKTKLTELLSNSKKSIESVERNFFSSLKNIEVVSDDNKTEDEQQNSEVEKTSVDEKNPDTDLGGNDTTTSMDITETKLIVEDTESIANGEADKITEFNVKKSKEEDTDKEDVTRKKKNEDGDISSEKGNTSIDGEGVKDGVDENSDDEGKVSVKEMVDEKGKVKGKEKSGKRKSSGDRMETSEEETVVGKEQADEKGKVKGKEKSGKRKSSGDKTETSEEETVVGKEKTDEKGKVKDKEKETSDDDGEISEGDTTVDKEIQNEKDSPVKTNGVTEENSCDISSVEENASNPEENSDADIQLNDSKRKSSSLSRKNKDQIAKAALLQVSSDSTSASSDNETGVRSGGSGMSGVDELKSDKEEIKLRKKRKKKEKADEKQKPQHETNGIDENNDEKEINRLTNLSNLKQRKQRLDSSDDEKKRSDDSEKENKKKETRKLSLKKQNTKKSLEEYLSNDSDAESVSVVPSDEDPFAQFNSFIDEKQRSFDLNKNEMSKKFLLDSSDSDNSNSDDEIIIESASVKSSGKKSNTNSAKKFNKKSNESDESDDVNKDDENNGEKSKKSRPSWKDDKLLKGKISENDTSDEDRIIQNTRLKKEKYEEKSKYVNDSSDSEDLFRPKKSTPIVKKRRTRVSTSSSDASYLQRKSDSSVEIISDDDRKKKKKTPKRRKRIKVMYDSDNSDDDANDSRVSGSASKGRKNIRRVMEDTDLTEQTRRTAKEEELRKKRISERQAMFNEAFKLPESSEETVSKLVLDFDPQTKEELISVHPNLIKKLKPHQAQGVKFMWDSCFESIKQIKKNKDGGGCILAHCMGLGKTLQVITLVHTILRYPETNVKTILVICPLSTVLNWVNEFEYWLKNVDDDTDINVFHLSKCKSNILRADCLRHWHEEGGVMILGYEMFRSLVNSTKVRKKVRERMNESLLDPGPDLVVCDEGHILKNESSAVSQATMKIRTLRRVVLTGTPLQNNLKEYHCMVQFVKPNLLGDKKEFLNRFANPITNGQYIDSTKDDVRIMKRRAHVLHKMLDGIVQRFDYNVLTPFLPPKHEFVISVALSDLQAKLYEHYIKTFSRVAPGAESSLFRDYQIMRLIWTHPYAMKLQYLKAKKIAKVNSDAESMKDFIVSGSDDESSSESSRSVGSEKSVISVSSTKSEKQNKSRLTRASRRELGIVLEEMKDDIDSEDSGTTWWHEFVTDDDIEDCRQGPKLVLLFAILRECETIGDKVLIFSQSIPSLDMIEHFLQKPDDFSQRISMENSLAGEDSVTGADYLGSWQKNVDYFRLDGQTPNELRSQYCNAFNRSTNHRSRLFLISTKAGGLGINLTSANRVIIFDASWNPSHDVQSIFRVYRFGQNKPCYIYRFLAQGTMEEKIYERQVTKLSISCRVVDEQQIDRHFSHNEIEELYTFNRKAPSEDETPKLPKDRLMAELLKEYKDVILSYHEHDSLLENVIDEELTEEERKHAWDEYENEKNRVIPPPNQTQWASQSQIAMNMMQFNDEAILMALRKEHPHQTNEQLKPMVVMVRDKLRAHYEQSIRHNQMMKMMAQMNNPQMKYANHKELNEQAQIKKAAFMHQMTNPLFANLPGSAPAQQPPNAGFESHWQSGYSTPKKSNGLQSSNPFSTYTSPVKKLFPKSPNVTPVKNGSTTPNPSPYKNDGCGSEFDSDRAGVNPLKTPTTWAFKWTNPNLDPSLLERVLKTSCQWRAKYEQIGDNVLMHLPFCVRTDTMKNKLSDYLQNIQFYCVVPEIVDPIEVVEIFTKNMRPNNLVN